ncbi:F-box domain [Arabidopsis thaliana x Arabidopsis arenosa]|uniref:F-box domain n=1 Tax=Arabidopsis thaliana x Arabidopsis arenosa TaxID=1240361 RepID=A0A8T2ARX1_9BRAS|nr:F-box domain [Arabidopsis thaliana x Arabidopsis arenosa]
MRETKKKVNWSELCPDLLRCVFGRLSFTDLNRAKSVCSTWHCASRGCVPKRNQIPWLLLFPREDDTNNNKSSCVLFIPDDRDRVYKTRDLGVDFVRSCCLATYGSWLLMMDPMWNLNILNPLTGERIGLPLTESFVHEKARPRLKTSIACLWVDEKSKDYLVVWSMSHTFMVFTKKGSNTWRRLINNVGWAESDEHMVYNHKAQKLYVYRNAEAVSIWCFSEDDPRRVFEAKYSNSIGVHYGDFLPVFTKDNVSQWTEEEDVYLREFVDGWVNIATTVSGQVLKIASTVQRSKRWLFSIFKPQGLTNRWDRMNSLGNEALIFDMGITVEAKDIPGVKRNSIYFSGVGYGRNNPDNIFVFNLTTHMIEPLPQCVFSSIDFSDARWFFPGC